MPKILLDFTLRVGILLRLLNDEAVSVQLDVHPQKIKITEGHVNSCVAKICINAEDEPLHEYW